MTENKNKTSRNKTWELVNFCEFDKFAIKSYCAVHNVDESLNLGDITKVDETQLKPFNMICGGSPCFPKGTKVTTKNGYVNIEDVKTGDFVLTHKNRYMVVNRVGGEKKKEIWKLKAQGFLDIYATDYHPFYVKKSKTDVAQKIKLLDIEPGNYIGSIINTECNNKYNLTNEQCWILGRYVADGHIRYKKRNGRKNSYCYNVILSIGDAKVEDVKKHIKSYNFSCYPHTKSTHRVVISSKELTEFIKDNNFGTNALTKSIPRFILDLPIDKLKSFLDGYMSGDGCEIKNSGLYSATTISKKLAMSLCLAVQKVYRVGCRIYYSKRPKTYEIDGRAVNQHDTYIVRFYKDGSRKHLWFIENDIVWYPVKSVEKTNRIEDVFNIEVNIDHTYVANNAIVFNCQDFSVAGKQKGSLWTCKDCGHEYNPLTVHWSERNKCPNCDSDNIEKTRSSLLVEYLRVIRANKPNFGIYENVKNIVGKKFINTTFKLFEDELHEYGYNTYWKVLNAKNYGIPQNRERVYLIFIKKELDNGKFVFPDGFDNGIRLKDVLEDEVDEKYYISEDKLKRFITSLNNKDSLLYDVCQEKRESETGEYNNRQVIYDNAVKQVGNIVNGNGNWRNPQRGRIYSTKGCSPSLNTCSGGGLEPKILQVGRINSSQDGVVVSSNGISPTHTAGHGNTPKVSKVGNTNPSGKGMNDNVFSENGLAPTLTTNKGEGYKIAIKQATKKGYIECEIGGVADLSYPNSKTRRGRVQEDGKICPTLTATETGVCRIESDIRIRKLTPKECWRLMGFDDKSFKAAEQVNSNSQLYKQAGNSIVVDVLYYIFVELYKAMPYLFDNLKLSSFFSGIGAFEVALDRLYQGINEGNFIKGEE